MFHETESYAVIDVEMKKELSPKFLSPFENETVWMAEAATCKDYLQVRPEDRRVV
jgi:hypothetical protein